MKIVIAVLRVALIYVSLCLGVELYNHSQFEKASNRFYAELGKEHPDFEATQRCLNVEHDIVATNPFNLPKAIKSAATDFMTKEGCK